MKLVTTLLILITIFVVIYVYSIKRTKKHYDYKCFLLTLKNETNRQKTFFSNHNENIPIEIIYGPDTRNVKIARKYEDYIEPNYFEKAIEMHYNSDVKRPDVTYFNLGAIGCFMGHMDFYKRCFDQGLKYAVIFEDNVVVKSNELYNQIQSVIDQKGDDFEMCFFHCLSRLCDTKEGDIERVKWISSTKCYLIHVDNMRKYHKYFLPMDNHIDMKHEDVISKGARVYYKDLRKYMIIDRSHKSIIGHSDHGRPLFVSRQHPDVTPSDLKVGY
jgi:hypothetical protein